MYPLPVADRSLVVTITLIGVTDNPPDNIMTTSTNPDDSEPMYRLDSKFTFNTIQG